MPVAVHSSAREILPANDRSNFRRGNMMETARAEARAPALSAHNATPLLCPNPSRDPSAASSFNANETRKQAAKKGSNGNVEPYGTRLVGFARLVQMNGNSWMKKKTRRNRYSFGPFFRVVHTPAMLRRNRIGAFSSTMGIWMQTFQRPWITRRIASKRLWVAT